MIGFIEGILETIETDKIIINTGGIGFEVFVSSSVLNKLPHKGQKIKILTHFLIKEELMQLYGFSTLEEKRLFLQLLSVSGIGPKSAMNIISSFNIENLVAAIAKGDVNFLSSVPGIGKKTAQRVIVELKEKIAKAYSLEASEGIFDDATESPLLKEAVSALIALGYSSKEARKAVTTAIQSSPNQTIENIIKASLKNLSQV